MLVHLDSSEPLEQYGLIGVDFDPSLIRTVEPSAWPRHWRSDPAPAQLRSIGDDWILRGRPAVLRVPSALVPGEDTLLLNPVHQDFARARIGQPLAFRFDPRLATKT